MPKRKINLVIHSGKSNKTAEQDRRNFYASNHGKELMRQSGEHQKNVQAEANTLMQAAAKEGRGLRDNEIEEVLDNLDFKHKHRGGSFHSRTSAGVKRYVAKVDIMTGKAEWVPIE